MKPYSEGTHEVIDEEVKKVVDDCYKEVKALLESKKELIHR
jgi:ATP-dependent Zn protease